MALMKWREPNVVKQVGFRPYHRGTFVSKYKYTQNATDLIYTVPATYTLFITDYWITFHHTTTGTESKYYIRDTGDVEWVVLGHSFTSVQGNLSLSMGLFIPIEVPAGYDVCNYCSNASGNLSTGFCGWIEIL